MKKTILFIVLIVLTGTASAWYPDSGWWYDKVAELADSAAVAAFADSSALTQWADSSNYSTFADSSRACSVADSLVGGSERADTASVLMTTTLANGGISSSSDDWTAEAGSDASPGGTWTWRTNKAAGTNVDVVVDTNYVTMDQGLVVTGQLKSQQCETFSWLEPDAVGAIGNGTALTFRYFDETTFPDGCTIDEIIMDASEAITDTFVVQEWSDAVGTSKATVDSVMFSAASQVQITSGFDDADISANAHLALLFRTAPSDFNILKLTVIYTKD